ncbi:anti-sigma-I factor RsgI6-like [Mytilus galloprovincialis]|uniref:anti-sigma-I factor RsgI6-like n=1 Tax=Mytilus galloprovincialis TaxID=29158 RepID=UPI003F7BBF9F
MLLPVIALFIFICNSNAANLLGNGDFENGNLSPWDCQDCSAKIIQGSNHYHGQHSVEVSGRHHNWAGIAQTFSVTGGHYYKCSIYIKLLNLGSGKSYAHVNLDIDYQKNGHHYLGLCNDKFHEANLNFEEIGGDFHIPSGVNQARVYVQVEDPSVNYIVDYASCEQIPHDAQWRSHANARIDSIRKGPLTIKLDAASNLDTSGLSVQIKQTKSKFAFGTAFNAPYVTDSSHTAYQQFIYDNFEWGVPENALKWKLMEWTKGHINYNKGMDAVKKLRAHGIKVRGHNMFWDDPNHIPEWLKGMSSSQTLQLMHKRVNDMVSHSKGTLEHWDVNNENLHAHPFEDLTHDPHITQKMFDWIHALEPNNKLFLNEYNVITSSYSTTPFKSLGKRYKDSGVPISGMGIQGHFGSSNINLDVLKYRLDKVAEAGLPIWITELTFKDPNENNKATALDNVMTMFFSHPAIDGVLLWGFWENAIYDKQLSLATGSNVTPNAAGRKWIELFHQRFRTNESHNFHGSNHRVDTRVFYGEHQLILKQNGKTIHTENVSFTQARTATIHLQGTGQNIHVSNVAFG